MLLAVACTVTAIAPVSAVAGSLPQVTSGARPGPAILYAPAATAPQLTNAPGSGWRDAPILISGAHEYKNGDYVYQGYLFDDLAFRGDEPMPDWSTMGLAWTTADAAAAEKATPCFWRECAQAKALAAGDVSPFYADVDFAKLLSGQTDTSGIPQSGSMDRIFASHFAWGQGVNFSNPCGRFPASCHGMFVGNLQPYEIDLPAATAPKQGFGLVLQLHASTANFNEYMGSRNQSEFTKRGQGAIALTPLARDPQGDYTDATEADVFEAWADVARHYRLDPAFTDISGYSMGGGGTYKLIERWPDLFARGMGTAAAPMDDGDQEQSMASLRNDPIMTWISSGDEGTTLDQQQQSISSLESHGLRFTFDQFAIGDHLTLATNDEYGPAAAFLGTATTDLNPPHVTYVLDPASDFPATGVIADHAYWLSGLTVRTDGSGALGQIDAFSEAFGTSDPTVNNPTTSVGALTGGYHGPMPYAETTETWAAPHATTPVDRLDVTATNVATATIDAARAKLDCQATLQLNTDGPVTITIPACHRTIQAGTGHSTWEL